MTSIVKRIVAAASVGLLISGTVRADVWMWTDQLGETHFVESARPMFTWVADNGKVYFSDTPGHATAIMVQLMWHSAGNIAGLGDDVETDRDALLAAESPEDRELRREAESKYCQRVTEIHESYINAPNMYRTNEDGEREYLKKYEVRAAIREIESVVKDACNKAA